MKKCRQKHGGFWSLLTPYGSSAYRYLPLTNGDPELLRRPSPTVLQKSFMAKLVVFGKKIKDKIAFFGLVDARICKNNVELFLLAGKNVETFNFISFYWLSLHFDSQSLQKCVKIFCQTLMRSLFIYWVYPYKHFCLQHQALIFTLIELIFMLFISTTSFP